LGTPAKTLPKKGLPREEVLARMETARSGDAKWREGRTWSLVYFGGPEITALLKEAYTRFFSENALNPMAFPSLKRFEAEVVAMTAALLGGDDRTVGNMTSGGSESIMMAVKTARDWARAERPEITEPEMVLPETAHPAFLKAAHYFGVKAVRTPVTCDWRADPEAMRRAVTRSTILLVGSAPAYPQGTVDPIPEIAALAAERGVLCHVDSCLGGFILPFVRRLGYRVPDFDLSVPGVTSISADVHKYGFAAKGASVILYRDTGLRRHQYFTFADWCGGLYASPTMTGTRPGGAIAAAWAVMNHLGEEGYLELARISMETARRLIDGIEAIPELRVMGRPDMTVFAFTSDEIDVYTLAEVMEKKGWHMDRQQLPPSLHMMVTPAHAGVADRFLGDLEEAVREVAALGPDHQPEGMAAIYGGMAKMPDRGLVRDFLAEVMDDWTRVE